jgi:hypothetical protein
MRRPSDGSAKAKTRIKMATAVTCRRSFSLLPGKEVCQIWRISETMLVTHLALRRPSLSGSKTRIRKKAPPPHILSR